MHTHPCMVCVCVWILKFRTLFKYSATFHSKYFYYYIYLIWKFRCVYVSSNLYIFFIYFFPFLHTYMYTNICLMCCNLANSIPHILHFSFVIIFCTQDIRHLTEFRGFPASANRNVANFILSASFF
jgi:hypothetical protein